jgi:hypothetical protein
MLSEPRQPLVFMGSRKSVPLNVTKKKTRTPEPKPHLRDGAPITIADIKTGECRWMLGTATTPDTPMCANAVHERGVYCQHHMERANGD